MKRTVCLFTVCLLIAAWIPAVTADSQAPAPIMLLDEEYNPFSAVAFPESYALARVKYDLSDVLEYSLVFSASDAMNDVIAFAAGLLPDENVDEMRLAMSLMSGGGTDIDGTIGDLSVRIEITDTQFEGAAESGGRFEVEVTAILEPEAEYVALFEANLRHPVIQEIAAYFPVLPFAEATITIWPDQSRAEMYIHYPLENAGEIRAALLAAYPNQYYEPNDWMIWEFGDMKIIVTMENAANGELCILTNFASPDVSLLDYVPEATLQNLGFDDYRESSAKCSYQDDQAGVWLSVSKDAWGENNNEAERNAFTFMTEETGAFILIFYDPETKRYAVTLECNGAQAKYLYSAADGSYTDAAGGSDLASAKQVATDAFLAPGEELDDVLQLAVMLVDTFVSETFGCTLDELYEMEYE